MSSSRKTAAQLGRESTCHASDVSDTWGPVAGDPALSPRSGGSVDDLVTGLERGLLVSDFWYTRVVDPKRSVWTGLTRNGVWLVEDGEVTAAVGNMRFTQSYPLALAPGAVLGVGAEVVPLPHRSTGVRHSAPALHLASWNLTGNASG